MAWKLLPEAVEALPPSFESLLLSSRNQRVGTFGSQVRERVMQDQNV